MIRNLIIAVHIVLLCGHSLSKFISVGILHAVNKNNDEFVILTHYQALLMYNNYDQ